MPGVQRPRVVVGMVRGKASGKLYGHRYVHLAHNGVGQRGAAVFFASAAAADGAAEESKGGGCPPRELLRSLNEILMERVPFCRFFLFRCVRRARVLLLLLSRRAEIIKGDNL